MTARGVGVALVLDAGLTGAVTGSRSTGSLPQPGKVAVKARSVKAGKIRNAAARVFTESIRLDGDCVVRSLVHEIIFDLTRGINFVAL